MSKENTPVEVLSWLLSERNKSESEIEMEKKAIAESQRRIEDLTKKIISLESLLPDLSKYMVGEDSDEIQPASSALVKLKGKYIKERVFECLKANKRQMQSSEIVKILHPYYPDKTEIDLKGQVASILSVNENVVAVGPKKQSKWVLKEWLNEDGTIKEEHI